MITSAKEFVELRDRDNERATFDSAPESVWLEVVERYPAHKEWVAHNKTVPLTILRILARDPDPRVRFAVAMKRKCDAGILERLARDEDETVRVRVARNQKTPAHILERLRNDTSRLVAEALASRS
jgi:hypothetical protein